MEKEENKMCWHKWEEYKDLKTNKYYVICKKCGVAGEYDSNAYCYKPNKYLCKTNSWIDRETFRLRYELNK